MWEELVKNKNGWFFYMLPKTSIRDGDGTPLQYSYLENPMDGGAW